MTTHYHVITVDADEALKSSFLSLRQVSKEVDPYSQETRQIVDKLFYCLENWEQKGVGLSAPQVGILARIFVVNIPAARKKAMEAKDSQPVTEASVVTPASNGFQPTVVEPEKKPEPPQPTRMAVINPIFSEFSEEKEKAVEGCLSIPGVQGLVPRHTSLRLQGIDENGNPIDIKATGFLARVFQHEYDHLDGVLYVDRMEVGDALEEPRAPAPKPETPPADLTPESAIATSISTSN